MNVIFPERTALANQTSFTLLLSAEVNNMRLHILHCWLLLQIGQHRLLTIIVCTLVLYTRWLHTLRSLVVKQCAIIRIFLGKRKSWMDHYVRGNGNKCRGRGWQNFLNVTYYTVDVLRKTIYIILPVFRPTVKSPSIMNFSSKFFSLHQEFSDYPYFPASRQMEFPSP